MCVTRREFIDGEPIRGAQAGGGVGVWAAMLIAAVVVLGGCATSGSSYRFADESGRPAHGLPLFRLHAFRSVQDRPGQDPDLALVVAISGGGHRAANFGLGVLLGLEQTLVESPGGETARRGDALDEVDYFTTVSGGAFAAGVYLSSLRDHLDRGGAAGDYELAREMGELEEPAHDPEIRRALREGFGAVLLKGTMALSPLRVLDRGDFIEERIDRFLLGARFRERSGEPPARATTRTAPGAAHSFQLGDVFVPVGDERVPRLPYWFVHATVYRNGAPLTFTPSELLEYGIVQYTHGRRIVSLRTGHGVKPGTTREQFVQDMPFAMAIKASSSFPGAIPATTLRSDRDEAYPFVHVLDGGIVDNLGLINAMRILTQESAPRRVLIIVDAYNRDPAPYSKSEAAPPALLAGAAAGVIPFDSRHGLMDEQLAMFARSIPEGIALTIIRLSFEDLDESDTPSRLSVRSISASFNLTDAEQKRLIAAGRLVVDKHRDEIINAMQPMMP